MRSKLISALTVFGAVAVLILAANTVALAATGNGFLLGKANKAHKVTKLKRTTPGPALALRTRTKTGAPLSVNANGLVKNLNADRLDGKHASELASAASVDELRAAMPGLASNASVAALADRLPFANGFVADGGSFSPDTSTGVTSVVWEPSGRYVVTLADTNYFYSRFQTTITPSCGGVTFEVSSVGGKMLVTFQNSGGTKVQCPFAFSTTRLQ